MKLYIAKLHYKKNTNMLDKTVISLLKIIGSPYSLVTKIRNKLYDCKILHSYNSKSFVISIGNITTGGVGKTPLTCEIAKHYLSLNKKVAIISRGYGAKLNTKKPIIISDGSGSDFSGNIAGDEPVWLAENCKGAVVVICRSRIRAEKYIKEHFAPDVIILDDGFQHRKMKRDLDLLLVDAKNKFGNELVLPAGPLRESLVNLSRADKIIVVNKSSAEDEALKYCDILSSKLAKKIFLCKIIPDYIYNIVSGEHLEPKTNIMAFSAIGQPESFYSFLKDDYHLKAVLEFEDHHNYDIDDISKIIHYAQEQNIDSVVTTEKDAVKIAAIIKDVEIPIKIYALKLKAFLDIKEICGV